MDIPNTDSPDDISNYDYHTLIYPDGLSGAINEAGGVPYMVFYINVDVKGNKLDKYTTQSGDEIYGNVPGYENQNRQGAGWNNTISSMGIKEAGKLVDGVLNSSVVKQSKSLVNDITADVIKEQVNGTIEEVGKATKAFAAEFDRSMKRLKSAIVLYMPHSFSTTYQTDWNTENNSLIGAFFDNSVDPNVLSEVSKSIKSGQTSKLVGQAAGSFFASQLSRDSNWQSKTGLAPNPRTSQQFSGVSPRSFQFTFTLAAKSRDEFERIKRIINTFKFYMHPYFHDGLKFSYRLPAEFDIEFYQGPIKNDHVNKISSCVLNNMIVDYTPNGNWSVHENGEPVQINVTLQFTELEILTRERISQGY